MERKRGDAMRKVVAKNRDLKCLGNEVSEERGQREKKDWYRGIKITTTLKRAP